MEPMPKKIRELKAMLSRAGFNCRSGKGSHTVWRHPRLPRTRVVLSGSDGRDAQPYQEQQVEAAIREAEGGS
jgi:predicted RNA binding protein YcfA (HicA-like mRNA interferase family)